MKKNFLKLNIQYSCGEPTDKLEEKIEVIIREIDAKKIKDALEAVNKKDWESVEVFANFPETETESEFEPENAYWKVMSNDLVYRIVSDELLAEYGGISFEEIFDYFGLNKEN